MASTFRFVWDGNVLLHETFKKDNSENTELTTWVFEGFVPTAKLVNGKAYSIISDHLGTPILAIDSEGNEVWNRQLDIYGRVKREIKASSLGDDVRPFIPFLYQGQYYDFETKLAYNRFRYYSPETGAYICQDPIGLLGGWEIYSYVKNNNYYIDLLGLRKTMPKGGWNYDNMPKMDDYQLHHIIPRSKSIHPAIVAAGFDVNSSNNLIYLPKEEGIHKTRSIHNGWDKGYADYNDYIQEELDKISDKAKNAKKSWTQQDYANEINELIKKTRKALRKGEIKCHS